MKIIPCKKERIYHTTSRTDPRDDYYRVMDAIFKARGTYMGPSGEPPTLYPSINTQSNIKK